MTKPGKTFDETPPVVSICCVTYNHEDYIADTINSFLMQETSFRYDIFVHDDASTDRTGAILDDFSARFPDKINVIRQTENQYSKIPIIFPRFILPHIRGKYVALCEGDDFWTDKKKLSKQFELLEANENIDLCFHNTKVHEEFGLDVSSSNENNKSVSYCSRAILLDKKKTGRIHTSSMMFRTASISGLHPWVWRAAPVGDLFIQAISGKHGALKMNKSMSVYRYNIQGSYTKESHNLSVLQMLSRLARSYGVTFALLICRRIYFSQLKSLLIRLSISYLSLIIKSKLK
jgi:glycosyltransferase involved in cell wall biosynthesis